MHREGSRIRQVVRSYDLDWMGAQIGVRIFWSLGFMVFWLVAWRRKRRWRDWKLLVCIFLEQGWKFVLWLGLDILAFWGAIFHF